MAAVDSAEVESETATSPVASTQISFGAALGQNAVTPMCGRVIAGTATHWHIGIAKGRRLGVLNIHEPQVNHHN